MSSRYDEPIAPKPFDFVPIAEPLTAKTVGHEAVRGEGYASGKLMVQLRALSPIFVASGSYALGGLDLAYTDEPVVRACYRVDGVPAIPGSSLKGVVRSIVEAVSPSCVSTTRLDARLIPYAPQSRKEGCQPDDACPACSMFGRMSRMAKVSFTDARLVQGKVQLYRLQALFRPHPDAPRVYMERGEFKGRKFYYHGRPSEDEDQPPVEVIERGSLLRGELHFENLSDAELGLLIFSLGLDASFALKLGGGKPSCLGSLRVEPGRLELLTRAHFLQAEPGVRLLEEEDMINEMATMLRAAYQHKLILSEQRDRLREILRYPNDRDCPTGLY
jgi:CRISPR/Cas system CSM-associated protein Csm3 (group 7 of RAMP superfamily)